MAAKQTLLAKAETISDSASDKGYRTMSNSSCEGEMQTCERENPADPEASAEGGAGGAPGTRAELFPAACDENHGEAGCPPAGMEDAMLEHVNVSIRKL